MSHRPSASATRRPTVDAAPVEVGAAGVWWFARPSQWMFPIFDGGPDAPPRVGSRVGFAPSIERKLTNFREAMRRGPDFERCSTFLDLATALLADAHDIQSDSALPIVLQADWPSFTRSILALAFGPPEGDHARQA